MTASAATEHAIPAHVPQNLVGSYPFTRGQFSTEQPHDVAERMHEGPAAFYAPELFAEGGGWVFRRIADMRAIAMDTEHFSNKDFAPFGQMTGGTWNMIPAEQDPPVHSVYRMMVNPLFTPKAINRLEEKITGYARQYVDAFKDKGRCEFMNDFALKFPINVFLDLMGLPQDRVDEFLEWETQLIHGHSYEDIRAATQAVVDYLRSEIAKREDNPGDDFIGFGLKATFQGRKLDSEEMLGFCFNLFIGGLESVSTHMGHFLHHLARHPEHQKQLRDDPSLISTAVDELLRCYGSVTTMRTCVKDREVAGVLIKAGDRVAMSAPLAGRDPEEFEAPGEVRFDRKPRHMSLGYGPHLCIGMHLARRELKIALETVLETLPEFRLDPDQEIVFDLGGVVQAQTVPLIWQSQAN